MARARQQERETVERGREGRAGLELGTAAVALRRVRRAGEEEQGGGGGGTDSRGVLSAWRGSLGGWSGAGCGEDLVVAQQRGRSPELPHWWRLPSRRH
jgi:hypothetical protein